MKNPRLLVLGSYTDKVCFDYGKTMFNNELDIIITRDQANIDLVEMIEMIADGKIKPAVVPRKIYSYNDAQQAYQDLLDKKVMRVLFNWE